jgi:hypothetical protein
MKTRHALLLIITVLTGLLAAQNTSAESLFKNTPSGIQAKQPPAQTQSLQPGNQPVIQSISPSVLVPGKSTDMVIRGTGLTAIQDLSFGPGVTVSIIKKSDSAVHVRANAVSNAAPGQRSISYSDTQGKHESRLSMIAINPQPEPPSPKTLGGTVTP